MLYNQYLPLVLKDVKIHKNIPKLVCKVYSLMAIITYATEKPGAMQAHWKPIK